MLDLICYLLFEGFICTHTFWFFVCKNQQMNTAKTFMCQIFSQMCVEHVKHVPCKTNSDNFKETIINNYSRVFVKTGEPMSSYNFANKKHEKWKIFKSKNLFKAKVDIKKWLTKSELLEINLYSFSALCMVAPPNGFST